MFFAKQLTHTIVIGFACVATHNHLSLTGAVKSSSRSAPVIKLPAGATEDDHLALLGVLNSSTACFWLKQNSHDKGNARVARATSRYAWEDFYEFTGTTLQDYPLPACFPCERGRTLDRLAQEIVEQHARCSLCQTDANSRVSGQRTQSQSRSERG